MAQQNPNPNQNQAASAPKVWKFTMDKKKKQELIEKLANEISNMIRIGIAEQLDPVKEDFKKLQADVAELKIDVKGIKSDLKEFREDFNAFRDSRYKMDREVAQVFNRGHHQLLPNGDDE